MSYNIPGVPFWIDRPNDPVLRYPIEQIRGWIGIDHPESDIRILFGGIPVEFAPVPRPDLADRPHFGFSCFLDLPRLRENGLRETAAPTFQIIAGDYVRGEFKFPVSEYAWGECDRIRQNQLQKAEFIQRHVKRPLRAFQGCRAPSDLPDDWDLSPRLTEYSALASAHFYGPEIRSFLATFDDQSFILDAGSGLRRLPVQNVINLEICDYPSTDILAVGEDLPFQDNTFDAVLSLAVLEHVKDPFRCANELIRVTKPGGKILSIVPFLQAEHGYPSHFANFTRFGIRELFKNGTVVERHFLDASNQPIYTLHQILRIYSNALPQPVKDDFLNTTVREFLSQDPYSCVLNKAPFVEALPEDDRWIIASGTTLIVRKI